MKPDNTPYTDLMPHQASPPALRGWRNHLRFLQQHPSIPLVIIVGLFCAWMLFIGVQSQISSHLKQEFEWVAQDRHRAIRKGFESAMGALHELHDLFLSSPQIQAQSFQRIAALIRARYPEIESLQWVPLEPSPDNPNTETARIAYQEPSSHPIHPIGFDHYTDPARFKLLEEARDTGRLVVSRRIPLATDDPYRVGFLAVQPVYQPDAPTATILDRHQALSGYVIGIFQFANLAEEAVSMLEPRGVECMILDEQAPETERFLHFYTSRLTHSTFTFHDPLEWKQWLEHPDPKLAAHTRLGSRIWSITCSQTSHFRSAEWFSQGHWITLLTAILLTGLLTHHLFRIKSDLAIRTRITRQLHESTRLLSALFHQSPDIIRLVDRHGASLLFNHGQTNDDTDPTLPDSMPSDAYRLSFFHALDQAFETNTIQHFQHRANDHLWWELRIVPLHESHTITSAMVIATDISENKTLEEQAAKNARLAALGLMAAGVAHEINNPNNSIYYNATLLSDSWLTIQPILDEYFQENGEFAIAGLPYSEMRDKLPTLIGWIIDNTRRIQKIVELLKNLARNDSTLDNRPLDLNQLVQGTLLLLNNTIHKHTERFDCHLPPRLPKVLGNSGQLEQVLINVIVNALQSLPDRSHGVQLEAAPDPSGREVTLIVRDQGRGIHPSCLDRITEPFFTTRLEKGGTGLGLSISASIIKNHGGQMRFESTLNSGTTVFISLPCTGDP